MRTHARREGPNTLAVAILFILMGLSGLTSAVDGPATLIVVAAVLALFLVMRLLAIGWREPGPRVRPQASVPVGPATRLPRGRVVRAPKIRNTPTT